MLSDRYRTSTTTNLRCYPLSSPHEKDSISTSTTSLMLLSINEDQQLDASSLSLSQCSISSSLSVSSNGLLNKGHWGNVSYKRNLFALGQTDDEDNDDDESTITKNSCYNCFSSSACQESCCSSDMYVHQHKKQRSIGSLSHIQNEFVSDRDGPSVCSFDDDEYEQFVETSEESWGLYSQ